MKLKVVSRMVATSVVNVTVESPSDAEAAACEASGQPSLCWQCSDEVDLGDTFAVEVLDKDDNVIEGVGYDYSERWHKCGHEHLAEVARDVVEWLRRSGLGGTAHERSLAQALGMEDKNG